MLKTIARNDTLYFVKDDNGDASNGFSLNFQRTLRIPDDGKTYPLPPGLGRFPIRKVSDYSDKVPESWIKHGGVFIPMYQREALWIRFGGRHWRPNAVKVAIGKINAVSGERWDQALHKIEKRKNDENWLARTREVLKRNNSPDVPQDYLACPPQPWLDGINAGKGYIKQFVAMPLGMGYTVEGQVTGKEEHGGIQIIVYEPKPGKFPDEPPPLPPMERMGVAMPTSASMAAPARSRSAGMGLGAGGKMKQKIYPDPHGIDTWDQDNYGRIYIHIVNSLTYREITGEEAPPTPITAKTYAQHKLPWFDLYDEAMGDVDATDTLKKVKSVKEMDADKGFEPQQDDDSIDVPDEQIIKYKTDTEEVEDGEW